MSEVRSCRRPGGQASSREAAAGNSLASGRAAGCFQPGVRTRRRCPARGRAAGGAALHRRPRAAGAGRQPPPLALAGATKLRGPAAAAAGRRAQFWNMPARLCAACPALRRRGAAAAAAHWLRAARPQPQQRHQARAARRRTRRNDMRPRRADRWPHDPLRPARREGGAATSLRQCSQGGGGGARGAWPKNGAGACSRSCSAPTPRRSSAASWHKK